jgi:hypothetical protein
MIFLTRKEGAQILGKVLDQIDSLQKEVLTFRCF